MARSEDYGQGRRTRRPYEDQDLADRRPQSNYAADPPTQGRRAGTSYAPQFDHYASQPGAEPARSTSQAQTPRTGRADPRHSQPGYGHAQIPQSSGWDDQGYAQDASDEAWAQSVRSSFGARPPAAPSQQQGYDQHGHAGYGYDQQQGYGQGQGQDAGYGYADQTGGYANHGRGYQQGYGQHPGYDETQQGQYGQGQRGYANQAGYDQYPQDYQQGYGEHGYQGDDQILANGDYVETGPHAASPPPSRSRRGLIIAGAFVAAVLIGGGLGFVYKMTSEASFSSNGEPPLLTAGDDPVKSVPEEAAADDGTSKSIYDRLNSGDGETSEGSSTVALGETSESVDVPKSDEARLIETDPVVPGVGFAEESPADGGEQTATVGEGAGGVELTSGQPKVRKVKVINVTPGETIDAGDGGTNEGAGAEEASVPELSEAGPALDGEALTPTATKKKTQAAATEQLASLTDTDQATTPATTKAKGSGYVVQASVANTEVEALGAFADMQSRYGSLLSSSQPDIQKIDGNKGYRLRIGPPTSKQAASTLCNKLKAAGHKDCFIRQY
jgi:hypothetical protein